MRLRVLLALFFCAFLLLSACRPPSTWLGRGFDWSHNRPYWPEGWTTTERVVESGYLRVGLVPELKPPKETPGRPVPGHLVMERLARMMGAVPYYYPGRIEDLLMALDSGVLDLVVLPAGMSAGREAVIIPGEPKEPPARETVEPGLAALVRPGGERIAALLERAAREAAAGPSRATHGIP